MKAFVISIMVGMVIPMIAQRVVSSTESFSITGKVKKEMIFSVADINAFPSLTIKDIITYNHKGEIKDTLTGLKGARLKDLLKAVEFSYEKPKELNLFYLVFIGSEGYKVVFSWNEIYNTPIGEDLYIITEMEGEKLAEIEHRIICISAGDSKVGRRFVKGLDRIEVRVAE